MVNSNNPNMQVRLKKRTLVRLLEYRASARESYDEIINRLLNNPNEIRYKYNIDKQNLEQYKQNIEKLEKEVINKARMLERDIIRVIAVAKQNKIKLPNVDIFKEDVFKQAMKLRRGKNKSKYYHTAYSEKYDTDLNLF